MFVRFIRWGLPPLVMLGLLAAAWVTRDQWLAPSGVAGAENSESAGHAHGNQAVDHIELSEQARRNLGLKVEPVQLRDYWRSLSVPGLVIERPGHSDHAVTATVAGVIQKVHVFPGQAVFPGDALFDLQPTGEALATTQSSLLNSLQELEVVEAELARISPLVANEVLPEKEKLELEYRRKRLQAAAMVQKQELLVRGLSEQQVEEIVANQSLVKRLTVTAPTEIHSVDHPGAPAAEGQPSVQQVKASDDDHAEGEVVYTVESLLVHPGKLVERGAPLCHLALHSTLYIEGHAFEKEADLIAQAGRNDWPVVATFEVGETERLTRENLHILYMDNVVDSATRTFHFYLPLHNEVAHDARQADGKLYRAWRFKPGQKVRLRIPIEHWEKQLVLPADAVVRSGPEAFVFQENGKLLVRRPVQVQYSDNETVVIANDGSVFPGERVAMNNAYQLNLALKKASGEGDSGHHHGHAH